MDIEPFPQADDKLNTFLDSEDDKSPFDKQMMDYLNTVPQARRQEIYSELITDGEVTPSTLSDLELKSLGMRAPDSSN